MRWYSSGLIHPLLSDRQRKIHPIAVIRVTLPGAGVGIIPVVRSIIAVHSFFEEAS